MIALENLSKNYKNRQILKEVNYTFPENTITLIVGENGAGKTTLFKCILGLERYSGQIRYRDVPLTSVRSEVVAVFDDSPFYDHLTGSQNLTLLAERKFHHREVAEIMGSSAGELLSSKVKTYSSGQRKRLALSYAVLRRPKYVLLDEVANGVDLAAGRIMQEALVSLAKSATIIATGHVLSFYAEIVSNVAILHGGKLTTPTLATINAETVSEALRRL